MGGVGASQRPRVSVAMVTYNQEKFLAQAIESVLAQDFTDWELVIGEDCSTDGTLAVATRYEAAHPDRIRLLRDEVNLGGRGNYIRTLTACRGEFLAQLDGDDYWMDPTKLSRQVALLDAHPECALVFGATLNDRETPGMTPEVYYPPDRREFYDIEDLLRRNFIGSGAVLWREPDIEGLPDWFKTVAVGDWPIHVLCARGGRIGYIDDTMCVHREHNLGVWGGLSILARTQQRLDVRDYFRAHFEGGYEDVFDGADLADHFHLAKTHRKAGNAIRACTESLWCLRHRKKGDKPTALRVMEEALHAVVPKLVCLGLGSFAIFGLLAAREPGAHWIWRVIYLALGALCVYGLLPRRARHRG